MIHIKDDWYIDVDELSYNLQQYAGTYIDKQGVERTQWKNVTYHSTFASALERYTRYRVRDALKDDIELKEAIITLKNELESVREDTINLLEGM